MLQFDGNKTTAVYNFKNDRFLKHNLKDTQPMTNDERLLKATIQQYIERLINDQLTIQKP